MNIKEPILFLAALMLLSACSSGPDFKAPPAPKTDAYTSKDDALRAEQRIALGKQIEAGWWTLFASRPLDDLIRQTVQNNYDLASARESLAQAEEAVKAESGNLLPQVSLDAVAGRQKYGVALFGPSNFSIPPFSYYEAGASASWTPDLSGGGRRAVERQQALADYQAHQMDSVYVALTGDTVAAALEMASASTEIAAARDIIATDRKTLALIQEAYTAGASAETDVLTVQNRLDTDRAMLPPLEQRLSVGSHALTLLVGKAPADWTPPGLDLDEFALPAQLPVNLPSELVEKRPDILAAEADLHAASAAIGVATANLYPHITLTANMMQEALTPSGIFKAASNAWSLASGLTAPLFDGGELNAEKRAAEHAYQASLARYRQTILIAFRQVADALTALAHDDEEFAILNSAMSTAGTSLDLAQAGYQAGATGLMQVQDAERAKEMAQLDIIRIRHQRYQDCVRLFVALGGSPISAKQPWN